MRSFCRTTQDLSFFEWESIGGSWYACIFYLQICRFVHWVSWVAHAPASNINCTVFLRMSAAVSYQLFLLASTAFPAKSNPTSQTVCSPNPSAPSCPLSHSLAKREAEDESPCCLSPQLINLTKALADRYSWVLTTYHYWLTACFLY